MNSSRASFGQRPLSRSRKECSPGGDYESVGDHRGANAAGAEVSDAVGEAKDSGHNEKPPVREMAERKVDESEDDGGDDEAGDLAGLCRDGLLEDPAER